MSDSMRMSIREELAENEAEITRLRADVARLTQERDEARRGYGDLRVRLEERSRELATAMGQNERYRRALERARRFIEYARYELEDGPATAGTQFPTQDCADKELARIDAALAEGQDG